MDTVSSSPNDTTPADASSPRAAEEAITDEKPFLVLNIQHNPQPDGTFTPKAIVGLTPALRTSGLLSALPPEDLQSLLFLLTFLHPNGHIQPSIFELARAMAGLPGSVQARIGRLTAFRWRERPLAVALSRENGLDAFALSPHLIQNVVETAQREPDHRPPILAAGREAVVAHSRQAYSRPRAAVEREIEAALGYTPPAAPATPQEAEKAELRRALYGQGITRDQAQELLSRYPPERIRQQITWLPYRHANNPTGLLVAAIHHDYEEPRALRRLRPEAMDVATGNDPPVP